MRYKIIAILSLLGFSLICLNEYYNDSPEGAHYLEFPIGVGLLYYGLLYALLLGIYELSRAIYLLIKKVASPGKKNR